MGGPSKGANTTIHKTDSRIQCYDSFESIPDGPMNVALTPLTNHTRHHQSNTQKKKGFKHFLKNFFKKKSKQQDAHHDEDPQYTPAKPTLKKKVGMKHFFKKLFGCSNTTAKEPA